MSCFMSYSKAFEGPRARSGSAPIESFGVGAGAAGKTKDCQRLFTSGVPVVTVRAQPCHRRAREREREIGDPPRVR